MHRIYIIVENPRFDVVSFAKGNISAKERQMHPSLKASQHLTTRSTLVLFAEIEIFCVALQSINVYP